MSALLIEALRPVDPAVLLGMKTYCYELVSQFTASTDIKVEALNYTYNGLYCRFQYEGKSYDFTLREVPPRAVSA